MTRPLRIQYPGAVYHVITRGDHLQPIFVDDRDRADYLEIVKESLSLFGVTLFAYALMGNHVHLLLKTPLGNLSQFMQRLNVTCTSHINRRHKRVGHLFQGRYQSYLVEEEKYLAALSLYIHLNPVRTRAMEDKNPVEKIDYLRKFTWNSVHGYRSLRHREEFIDYSLLLARYGGDNPSGRRCYWNALCRAVKKGEERKYPGERFGGLILGTSAFARKILKGIHLEEQEQPQAKALRRQVGANSVWSALQKVRGVSLEGVLQDRGTLRGAAMECLYRFAGWTNVAIGREFGLHYATVCRYRRKFRSALERSDSLQKLLHEVEDAISIDKI